MTLLSTPPVATADGEVEALLLEEPHLHRGIRGDRDGEVRERHRRLEQHRRPQPDPVRDRAEEGDGERGVGSHPEHERERDELPARVANRAPEDLGITDAAEQEAHREQGRDRHHDRPGMHPVELAELGRVVVEHLGAVGADPLEGVVVKGVARAPGHHGPLEQRERVAERVVTHDPPGRAHRTLGLDERRRRAEELRDVAGELPRPDARRCGSEADDHRLIPGADHDVVGVERAVADARRVEERHLLPDATNRRVGHLGRVEVGERASDRDLLGEERDVAGRPCDEDTRGGHTAVARQQLDVRLVLDLLSSGREQRRRRRPGTTMYLHARARSCASASSRPSAVTRTRPSGPSPVKTARPTG